jgi:hypothetical protein
MIRNLQFSSDYPRSVIVAINRINDTGNQEQLIFCIRIPIELLAGSHEKSFSSFFAPVVSLLTMIFLLRNDFVSSVPIRPVAPVISTDFEAPEMNQNNITEVKRVEEKCTLLFLL